MAKWRWILPAMWLLISLCGGWVVADTQQSRFQTSLEVMIIPRESSQAEAVQQTVTSYLQSTSFLQQISPEPVQQLRRQVKVAQQEGGFLYTVHVHAPSKKQVLNLVECIDTELREQSPLHAMGDKVLVLNEKGNYLVKNQTWSLKVRLVLWGVCMMLLALAAIPLFRKLRR